MGSGSRSSNSIGGGEGVNKRKKGRRAEERCEIVGWRVVDHEREQTGQIAVMRRQDDEQIDGRNTLSTSLSLDSLSLFHFETRMKMGGDSGEAARREDAHFALLGLKQMEQMKAL